MTTRTPRDFGSLRSRWSCAVLVLLLRQQHDPKASREAVRRFLHRGHPVYRRPRPILKPDEDERQAKPAELRTLLEGLPADEAAVWRDEVEVHTDPKIGPMWMPRGKQATVLTPGTNRKRHLSGSIHWRTGTVFVTEAAEERGRNGALFIAHLDELRPRPRRYKKVHVIRDNASCHTGLEVIEYLWKWEGRIEVHLPPAYSPDLDTIERVWWHLHENITRNHRCKDLGELPEQVFARLGARNPLEIESSVYSKAKAA